MSRHLLAEADHIDAWRGDHELWVFESLRRMDEILLANYMVFRDLTRAEPYALWIGDEAWESTTTSTRTPATSARRSCG